MSPIACFSVNYIISVLSFVDLQENQLESVIPREDKSHVMIVAGEYKKEIAELIQKNKEREKVTVQLLSDRSVLMTLSYDDVCEYTGNVDQLMEY